MWQLSAAYCSGLLPGPSGDRDLLTLSVSARKGYTLVRLAGEGDVTVRDRLHTALTAQVTARTPCLVVDLSRLRFIDASCLQVLWRVSRMAEEAGGSLVLATPQPMVARVMELCSAGQVTGVHKSVAKAITATTGARGERQLAAAERLYETENR
jgi:stage II sporulation protein AA (anti-sigma F factor antagonist)